MLFLRVVATKSNKKKNWELNMHALLGLRQFLVTESLLKWWKLLFILKPFKSDYFTLKALFVLKILQSFYLLFGHIGKWLDKVNFKNYDVTTWETNNCNTYIVQYL